MAVAVSRVLVIECGAAETRAAFLVDGEPQRFWFGPARGDESLQRTPQTGDIFAGRVRAVAKGLNGAFVDIGAARDGFLPFSKNEKPPVEGAAVIVRARRPQINAKGAVLTLDWKKKLSADAAAALQSQAKAIMVGALGEPADAAVEALLRCGPEAEAGERVIVTNDAAARRLIEAAASTSVEIESRPFSAFGIDSAVEDSLEQSVSVSGGARLQFYETEAGVCIDVDSAGAAGASNDKINTAAARRLFPEISRRAVAGRIVVDFLPPSGGGARTQLIEAVKEGLKAISGARFGKLSPDGLCDFTLPRRNLSLLMVATEPAGDGWPVKGRRLTLDWAAKAAIRDLEGALIARPSSAPRLLVTAEIGAYLCEQRPQWLARLAERFGARFTTGRDAAREMRAHEIVE